MGWPGGTAEGVRTQMRNHTLRIQFLLQEFLDDSIVIDICHVRATVVQPPQHVDLYIFEWHILNT